MKIKMYANYNVRGRKYPIYHPVAQDISEPVMITIPDEWETYHNNMAELVIVTPDGARNLAYEIESDPKGPFFWGANRNKWRVQVAYSNRLAQA
ncbi:hypothetical protein H8699_02035 [Christensenellaceae bacterium NSJ-44]|uniref:Uncharacterized protein n=1 Tax=Luoshenia tenuis TaxID=2763654 RepID=A0A926CXZ9_9FIRM|nr:hypothetical protein [Luoshenia tenuis]MBC8528218.1 hypothetical protein [Luoshenia tenuis]